MKKIKVRFPFLRLYLEIPLLRITTELQNPNLVNRTWEYIRVEIKFWKWKFEFLLWSYGGFREPRY